MKTRKTAYIIFDESVKQKERLEKLYGPGDYTTAIAKNIKRTKHLIVLFIILFLSLFMLQIFRINISKQGVNLDSEGNIISIKRPASGDATLVLEAELISDSGKELSDQGIKLMIMPLQNATQKIASESVDTTVSKGDKTQHEIRKAVYQLNSDTTDLTVTLPKQLSDGTRIYWLPKDTNNIWIMPFVVLVGGFAIYYNRDAGLTKIERAARESVLRELPEFVNKLVLLLNAGLILSNAFHKIVLDYERVRGGDNNYFYEMHYLK